MLEYLSKGCYAEYENRNDGSVELEISAFLNDIHFSLFLFHTLLPAMISLLWEAIVVYPRAWFFDDVEVL